MRVVTAAASAILGFGMMFAIASEREIDLQERGIPEPRRELDDSIRKEQERQVHRRCWFEGMPPAVVPLWSEIDLNSTSVELQPFRATLEAAYPDRYVRILALLECRLLDEPKALSPTLCRWDHETGVVHPIIDDVAFLL